MICFFILLVFAVLKISAYELKADGNSTKITCPPDPKQFPTGWPTSIIEATIDPGWNENNIYSVDVCAKLSNVIDLCPTSYYNSLYLNIALPYGFINPLSRSYPLGSELLDCYTFDAKQIAMATAGKNLAGAKIGAFARLAGVDHPDFDITFQVLLRAASYNATENTETIRFRQDHRIHSVKTVSPGCEVNASQQYMVIENQYHFTAIKDEAPLYLDDDSGIWGDGQFTITDFQCAIKCDLNECNPACPRNFTTRCGLARPKLGNSSDQYAVFILGVIVLALVIY